MQEKTTRSEETTQEKLLMSDTFTVWQEKLNRNMDSVETNITEINNNIQNIEQKVEIIEGDVINQVDMNSIISMIVALS